MIRGPDEFDQLQAGEILVCPYTNPTWTPLFELAAAAVVDTGSIGSHAAITAREYGIPAVMGTGDGTRRLNDGQQVEVDGSAGQVVAACERFPRLTLLTRRQTGVAARCHGPSAPPSPG